jgi:farnesyl-diphosphate farnesyltransferase
MGAPTGEDTLAADRAWAFEAVGSVSRTFALSIDLLEEPMASWVCTGYLLCRTADTVEDEAAIPPERRAALLDTYSAVLAPDGGTAAESFLAAADEVRPSDGGDDWAALADTDRALRLLQSFDPPVRSAMRSVIREMSGGMAGFLRRHADDGGLRLETVDELEEYCWYVAGTVGKLFTDLLDCYGGARADPDPEDARAFALLLQLVNIAKDVRGDYESEDNIYLPGEWLAAEGLDHTAVGDPERASAVARVVERVVEHAADHAPGARRYLHTLPEGEAGLLEAAGLPYLLALGTVRELRGREAEAVAEGGVKLSRPEVEALVGEMRRGITQAELTRLAEQVQAEPYAVDR